MILRIQDGPILIIGTTKNFMVLEFLSLKIGKKAENVRGGHIHDTTAFFGELQRI